MTLRSRHLRHAGASSASSSRRSNLAARVAVAAIGIPAVLAVNYYGGVLFAAVVGLVALIAGLEFDRMMRVAGRRPVVLVVPLAVVAIAVWPQIHPHPFSGWVGIIILVTALAGIYSLTPAAFRSALSTWESTIGGVIYLGLPLGFLTLIRGAPRGAWWVAIVLVITWAYDTGAYVTGRAFGRRPFMHHVSPSKTLEGVAGGMIASATAGLVVSFAVGVSPVLGLLVGLAGGAVAQTGDLVESMFKRQSGVKNSGSIIPGHGGILDRIDSLMFVTVFMFYVMAALGRA